MNIHVHRFFFPTDFPFSLGYESLASVARNATKKKEKYFSLYFGEIVHDSAEMDKNIFLFFPSVPFFGVPKNPEYSPFGGICFCGEESID